jgi:hypothetical protein
MTKRLKRRCRSGWYKSQNTTVLRVLMLWYSNGISMSVLVEDISRNKCFFQVRISHVLHFISACDLFTDSPSYF